MSEPTSLSPRLAPLLIQNDRRTGNLIHPGESSRASSLSSSHERTSLRDYSIGAMPRKLSAESGESLSPPMRSLDPRGMGPPEGYHRKASASGSGGSGSPPLSAGRMLSPTERRSRLPSFDGPRDRNTSIGHLLNHLSVNSRSPPPESERSTSPLSATHQRYPSPPMRPRPMHSHSAMPMYHEEQLDMHHGVGPITHRPDMYRRHSAHPYEMNRAAELAAYRQEFIPLGLTGSRAPISRTTKACNGCRIRKVRCDAGGGGPASEPSTCSRCREAGVPCVYSGVQKKRGPCPGTARPTLARRKSSMTNLGGEYHSPPAHSPSSRASYGFPPPLPASQSYPPVHRPSMPATWSDRPTHARPPPPPHHEAPRPDQPLSRKPSLFSWPNMEPAMEVDEREHRKPFPKEYSLRPASAPTAEEFLEEKGSYFGNKGRSLPPLRMVIDAPRRTSSYYDPM